MRKVFALGFRLLAGTRMKVLMAEDLKSVREHIVALLGGVRDIDLRFAEQDSQPLLYAIAEWHPDIVILDTRMRGMMTLGVLDAVREKWPGTAVVISAFFFEPYYREAYLRHGADFFFDKSLEWGELIDFLHSRAARVAPHPAEAPLPELAAGQGANERVA